MPYKENHFTNNTNDAPAQTAGAPIPSDEPIKHNGANVKSSSERNPFHSPDFFILCAFSLICLVLFFIYPASSSFSEFFVRYIANPIRAILGGITSVFPFSLAESIILFLPVGIVLFYIKLFSDTKKSDSPHTFKKYLKFLITITLVLLDIFAITVAPSYHRAPLNENLGIKNEAITPERLKSACETMVDMLNRDASEIYYGKSGQSYSKDNFYELSKEITHCFKKFSSKYDFISPVGFGAKPVALSEPMTYLHVSGVYTYFTGEANINVNYPDYILPHTVAHEMSHARGVLNEGDANFTAFLVCLESENPYVRYSGLMSIFPYITDALYFTDKEAYFEVMSALSHNIYEEYDAFSKFFEKYSSSKAAQISSAVNDTFLKANGQEEGINSYGLVVDLTVNYMEAHYGSDSTQT